MKYLALVLTLLLGGCAEFAAKLVTNLTDDYDYFRAAGFDYIDETIQDRVWVRGQCRMSLQMRVSKLQAEDKWDEADAVLRKRYTPLITQTMWDSRKTDKSLSTHVSTPWICGAGQ